MSAAQDFEGEQAPSLVALLLEEQQSLSAVERFAEKHDSGELPRQARFYRDLIPAALPGDGQHFAFRVDLDSCTGCKACVTACRSLNGLDENETWRDVGQLMGGAPDQPVLQTVTTACHHCEDPGCLEGCPVLAYEKDPVTGIVRHLDDQCIGCQYCILKCPYDVPKYSESRGIVRKCDMCTDRLAVGEAPACVQGCPNRAISIEIVDRDIARPATLLALAPDGMPDSGITRPTTRYVTRNVGRHPDLQLLRAADLHLIAPKDAHTPLAVMLVLVQLSVGMLLFDALAALFSPAALALQPAWSTLAATFALAGLGAAVFHLGRPLYAFRAFLGWRTSWMSREILVLGPFAGLAFAYAASTGLASAAVELGASPSSVHAAQRGLCAAALAMGVLGTLCSVMIYVDTHREFWSAHRTAGRFAGTVLVLGPTGLLMGTLVAAALSAEVATQSFVLVTPLCVLAATAGAAKLMLELSSLQHLKRPGFPVQKRSAMLTVGVLRPVLALRVAAGIAFLLLLPLTAALAHADSTFAAAGLSILALILAFAAELAERHLFFRAEAQPAMPGPG